MRNPGFVGFVSACVAAVGWAADLARQLHGLYGDVLPAARGRQPRQAQPALAVAQLQLVTLRSICARNGMFASLAAETARRD